MKKIFSFIIVFALMLPLGGCSYNSRAQSKVIMNDDKFEIIKNELKAISETYNLEDGIKEGDFIVIHGKLNSDIKILNKFVEESSKGNPSEITIVQYTVEGDPIITQLVYDGESYYGVIDSTRDKFGSNEYYTFEYLYLKNFNEGDEEIYYLLNDDSLTYDEINYYLSKENNYDVMNLFTLKN